VERELYIKSDLGTLVRVTQIFTHRDGANSYMEDNPEEAVIAVDGRFIFLANKNDLGKKTEKEEEVILHLSDWNMQDKYYQMPVSLLKEFKAKFENEHLELGRPAESAISTAWDWFHPNVDYGEADQIRNPIKYGQVDMTLNEYFLDWMDPATSFAEWEFEED
jgi:hypothetical protein